MNMFLGSINFSTEPGAISSKELQSEEQSTDKLSSKYVESNLLRLQPYESPLMKKQPDNLLLQFKENEIENLVTFGKNKICGT